MEQHSGSRLSFFDLGVDEFHGLAEDGTGSFLSLALDDGLNGSSQLICYVVVFHLDHDMLHLRRRFGAFVVVLQASVNLFDGINPANVFGVALADLLKDR